MANVMCYAGELDLRRVCLFVMQKTPVSSLAFSKTIVSARWLL